MSNIIAFITFHGRGFFVVPNAKYLAFGTPNANALLNVKLFNI